MSYARFIGGTLDGQRRYDVCAKRFLNPLEPAVEYTLEMAMRGDPVPDGHYETYVRTKTVRSETDGEVDYFEYTFEAP